MDDNRDQVKAAAPAPSANAADPTGEALGSEICARYGVDPGVVRSTSGFGLGRNLFRFAASRVDLLPALQQRWSAVNAEPSAAAQLDRVWFTQPPAIASPRIAATSLQSPAIHAASSSARHAIEPLSVVPPTMQAYAPSAHAIPDASPPPAPNLSTALTHRSPAVTSSGDVKQAPSAESASSAHSSEPLYSVEPSASPAGRMVSSSVPSRAQQEPVPSAAQLPLMRQGSIVQVPSAASTTDSPAPIMERPIFNRGLRHRTPVDRQIADSQPATSSAAESRIDPPALPPASQLEPPSTANPVASIVHRAAAAPLTDAPAPRISPAQPDSPVAAAQVSSLRTAAPQAANTDMPQPDATHPASEIPAAHAADPLPPPLMIFAADPVSAPPVQAAVPAIMSHVVPPTASHVAPRIHRQPSPPFMDNTASGTPQPTGIVIPPPVTASAASAFRAASAEDASTASHQEDASIHAAAAPHIAAAPAIASASAPLPPQTWPEAILDLRGGKANPALHPASTDEQLHLRSHPTDLVHADTAPTSPMLTPRGPASSPTTHPGAAGAPLETSPSAPAAPYPDAAATLPSNPNAPHATGAAPIAVHTIMRPPHAAPPPSVIHRQALAPDAISRTVPMPSMSTRDGAMDPRFFAARTIPHSAAVPPYMPSASSGVHRSVAPAPSVALQRATAPGPSAAVAPDPSFSASFPMPSVGSQSAEPAVNIKQLADNVYELLVERLASERQRRGA